MFRKTVIAFLSLWLFLIGASIAFFRSPSAADYEHYRQLMEPSNAKGSAHKSFATEQKRYHVSKQFLFNQGDERLQWRLKSASSELKFGQQAETIELVEYFQDVSCVMQEQIVYQTQGWPVQQTVRCLNADQAVYHYKTGQMIAERVKLARYAFPGKQWKESFQSKQPFMKGEAQQIEISFSQHLPSFKARGLQATVQNWGQAF